MTIEKQIENIHSEIGSVLYNHRASYTNGMALRHLHSEQVAKYKFALSEHSAPEVLRISNCLAHIQYVTTTPECANFGTIETLLKLSESSEEFKTAYGILQPLINQLAALEADQAAANLAAGEAESKRRNAMDEAKAQAISAIEREFALPEPQPEQEPEKPFRGRGLKPALVTV
tara:strand:- start:5147 stop:5668 length:522 start_codon:yes stop_codon:yes gene_type:complete